MNADRPTEAGLRAAAAFHAAGRILMAISESGVSTVALPQSGELLVGRAAECDLRIDDPKASRRHALVRVLDSGACTVEDLGSQNGTYLREYSLPARLPVSLPLDTPITIGGTVLMLRCAPTIVSAPAPIVLSGASRCTDSSAGAPGNAPGNANALEASAVGGRSTHCTSTRTSDDSRRSAVSQHRPSEGLVANGGFSRRLSPHVARIAQGSINVLLLGETGVGKEVFARRIHELSPRASKPMISLNCAAFAESLLESELFGYEKGAFTGAVQSKQGLIETADGGTLLLDEVGEMPLSLQAKLLRVLEQKEVQRIGALRPRAIDTRFLSATNRNLEAAVAAGRFRQDLFFRLNGVSIEIPPLRDQLDYIEELAETFVATACERGGRNVVPRIAPEVFVFLRQHHWPGNIRELRNVMERALLLNVGDWITLDDLPVNLLAGALKAFRSAPPPQGTNAFAILNSTPTVPSRLTAPKVPTFDEAPSDELARIISALAACDGNQTHAAKMLGIARRTLISRIETYHLPRPRKKARVE